MRQKGKLGPIEWRIMEETSKKGANETQRIGDWKGCIVRTVVDSDGMAVLGGEGKEGYEPPFSDISQRGIIEAVNVVDIPIKGRELKNLWTSIRGRCGGWEDHRGWHGFDRIHVR